MDELKKDRMPLPLQLMLIVWDYLPENHRQVHSRDDAARLNLMAREAYGWHQRRNEKQKRWYDHCFPDDAHVNLDVLKLGIGLGFWAFSLPLTDKWTLAAWYKQRGRQQTCDLIAPLARLDLPVVQMRYAWNAMAAANDVVSLHRFTRIIRHELEQGRRYREMTYRPLAFYHMIELVRSAAQAAAMDALQYLFKLFWPTNDFHSDLIEYGFGDIDERRKLAPPIQEFANTVSRNRRRAF